MERYGIGPVRVFKMLRKLSHDFNVPLTRLAAEVIANAQNSPR
ncbi:MAG: ANTAR domain-containing protein [Mycobacterium sp.]